jgi:integrase
VVKRGKTPVLDGNGWRRLIDTIPADTVRDLRDRALIATLTYGFARIGAALKMRVEDLQSKGSGWLRLHKQHIMSCHRALAEALHAYIAGAGIAADKKGFLFRTSRGHGGTALADQPMTQVEACAWCASARSLPASWRRSATTRSGRRGSRRISPTAARLSTRNRWPHTRACAQPSSMTARNNASARRGRADCDVSQCNPLLKPTGYLYLHRDPYGHANRVA